MLFSSLFYYIFSISQFLNFKFHVMDKLTPYQSHTIREPAEKNQIVNFFQKGGLQNGFRKMFKRNFRHVLLL